MVLGGVGPHDAKVPEFIQSFACLSQIVSLLCFQLEMMFTHRAETEDVRRLQI